jgi:hypothetical protein
MYKKLGYLNKAEHCPKQSINTYSIARDVHFRTISFISTENSKAILKQIKHFSTLGTL